MVIAALKIERTQMPRGELERKVGLNAVWFRVPRVKWLKRVAPLANEYLAYLIAMLRCDWLNSFR